MYFCSIQFTTKKFIFNKDYITEKISGTQSDLTFDISCWSNYTFRMKAVNRLGDSEPSVMSEIPCDSNPCRPSRHPIGVRAFGNQSNNLIITWNVRSRNILFVFDN